MPKKVKLTSKQQEEGTTTPFGFATIAVIEGAHISLRLGGFRREMQRVEQRVGTVRNAQVLDVVDDKRIWKGDYKGFDHKGNERKFRLYAFTALNEAPLNWSDSYPLNYNGARK
jgi:hypothetical protein